MPEDSEFHWFVPVDFVKSGYIPAPKQAEFDAESLLKSIQKSTAITNKDRAASGFPVIQLTSWIEQPEFDSFTHELSWSLKGKIVRLINSSILIAKY